MNELSYILGNAAKLSFEKLRKRYNKKRKDMKNVNRSGISRKEVEKAQKALELYNFLFWLDNFIYIRDGKTNVKETKQKEISSDAEDEEDDGEVETYEHELNEDISDDPEINISNTSQGSSFISSPPSCNSMSRPKVSEKRKATKQKRNLVKVNTLTIWR